MILAEARRSLPELALSVPKLPRHGVGDRLVDVDGGRVVVLGGDRQVGAPDLQPASDTGISACVPLPKDWDPKRYDTLLLHKATYEGLTAGKGVADLEKAWQPELEKYLVRRKAALLYPE